MNWEEKEAEQRRERETEMFKTIGEDEMGIN